MSGHQVDRTVSGWRGWAPFLVLLGLTFGFRLPPLMNANGVHSDAAIVGLQARHMLDGEWDRFLWGAGYQGSFDAWVIAAVFAVLGRTALALMLAPLVGHLLLLLAAYVVLQKRVGPWGAMVLCLPITFTPQAINGVVLYAPRQWCITAVMACIFLFDGAAEHRQPWARLLRFGGAGLVGASSLYIDLYGLQMLAGAALFGVGCVFDGRPRWVEALGRLAASAGGAGLGLFAVWFARQVPVASTSQTTLTLERVPHNLALLRDTCLPWVLGYKVFVPGKHLYPDLWLPPQAVAMFQKLGALTLGLGVASALVLFFFFRRIPWPARRLGALGLAVSGSSVAGFLLSTMPSDMWSARYLAPILWTAPFALAPLGYLVGARRMLFLLLPYTAVAALGGWLSYGPYVDGPLPRRDARGTAEEELVVARELRARGVKYAAAQYWLSYRLSFLFGEDPVVVPIDPGQDRYPPHRRAFEQAEHVAYIFHPSEPRATPQMYLPVIQMQGGVLETKEIAGFTVLIHHRAR